MNSAKQVFHNLVGCWKIRRVLGSYGHGDGTVKFTPQISESPYIQEHLSSLLYREELEVTYTSDSGLKHGVGSSAHQEYVYLYDEKSDKIIKQFVDGRHFYELKLDLEKMEGEGQHLCEEDYYTAKYEFRDKDHFTLSYDVKGPQKDYIIQTLFTRIKTPI